MAYHRGDTSASFRLKRDDGFIQDVPVSVFFATNEFPVLETKAIDICEGHTLDIGAGAGRHSLELLRRGKAVTALDILSCLKWIMCDRGVKDVVVSDIFSYSGRQFDTLLMLMNGIGMTGNLRRLTEFLTMAHKFTHEKGQIVCDSIDVSMTTVPMHMAYAEKNENGGRPKGQQAFVMSYGDAIEAFEWLHIDFASLRAICEKTGWTVNLIYQEPNGHYLCQLTKSKMSSFKSK
jgi:precorrin-6B methylase 2